jgi:N-acetyl-gamma-glutamyl-phosphate reductase
MTVIKVGIVGGTGYTGVELLRSLCKHPHVQLEVITSRAEEGVRVADIYPSLRGHVDLQFTVPNVKTLGLCDVVFFATPHAVSMNMMRELMAENVRVIDLSADFRLKDAALWADWYGHEHACPELIEEAVYGLAEFNREQIRNARLVAAPGCYPTSVQLGFLPLLEQGLIDPTRLIANSASGASGAGRGASVASLFAEVNDSFKAYAAAGHRHLPEIEQGLSAIANTDVSLTFVPHLLPMTRGIHSTLYAELSAEIADIQALYEQRYADEPFVDVLPAGSHPETRSVKGSNVCRISIHQPQGRNTVVVLAVIDNLVKGASGQAVQAMNIMFGFDEKEGIDHLALMP